MEIKRILVFTGETIKEVILTIPSLFLLRNMYPKAELIVLVKKNSYELIRTLNYIDRIIKTDDYTKSNLLEKTPYFGADLFISFSEDEYADKIAKETNSKTKIGPIGAWTFFSSYSIPVKQDRKKCKQSEFSYNLDILKTLEPELFEANYKLNTEIRGDDQSTSNIKTYFSLENIKGKLVVINPFSEKGYKNINLKQYSSIIKKLLATDTEIEVVIACDISYNEKATLLFDMIGSNKVHLFSNGGSLLNLVSLIEKASVYLGPLTETTYIASAFKKNIVAIYSKVDLVRWELLHKYRAHYISPDIKNKRENYKNEFFDKFNEDMEWEIARAVLQVLV